MSDSERFTSGTSGDPWEAIARVQAGEATPEERDALRRTLESHPERAALVEALDGGVRQYAARSRARVDVEAALARVMARRDESPAEECPVLRVMPSAAPAPPSARPARLAWRTVLLRAAAVLVVLLGGALTWRTMRDGGSAGPAVDAYATAAGERRTVELPDGSRARLAPESRLQVARGYGAGERRVELAGEAYFDVAHADAPFIVQAGDAAVRDIGTAFVVRVGPQSTLVVVTEGSVAIAPREGGRESVLRARDRGVVIGTRVVVERASATDDDTAWVAGRLVFRDANMNRVAAGLLRWYGVTLTVDPALAERRLTATFQDQTADEVLRVVAAAVGARLERRGSEAILAPAP